MQWHPGITIIDLRSDTLREERPVPATLPAHRLLAVSFEAIESGQHGLSAADGPLLILCEQGLRSRLAARFLRADGLDAQALQGGLDDLHDMVDT